MRVVEEDAFLVVKSKAGQMPSGSEDEETTEEVREKMKLAEKLKFTTDGFQEIQLEVPEDKKDKKVVMRQRHDSDKSSGPSEKPDSDADQSPPRRRRHDSDASPPRRRRQGSDSDASPPRRRRYDSDESPPRRRRSPSPVRRRRHDSPPSRGRRRQDLDSSPPRRRNGDHSRKIKEELDASPPRRRNRQDSDSSPPRRRRDSPPRRRRHDSDESPPRRNRDPSPPRRKRHDSDESHPRRSKRSPSPGKTLDGKKAGLVSAAEMREEMTKLKERESNTMKDLDDEISGRYAETKQRAAVVQRGKKVNKEDEEKKQREEKKTEELKTKYEVWNRGVIQLQNRQKQLLEEEKVMEEGFARYQDDERMNEYLKDQLLEDDPMADMIAKKKTKINIKKGLVYPTYKGQWPPNRFSIPPGYRWDGVDRSNGFEAKLQVTSNRRKAEESSAYRSIAECQE
ncbi:hypothetical protein FO519_006190 [Halicephalobus sp. NKZ332]|nr:hypothetical protein FO519_006190 [Halicephalobus sp. NKZ332]